MRVEWCKAIARVERFEEEVELTIEEMRRTLLFFECTARDWERRGEARVGEPTMDEETTAGVRAYAARQAALYRRLVDVFVNDWYAYLDLKSLGSDWLSKYKCPEGRRRRRLQSNVTVYHPTASAHVDETYGAPTDDPPSDVETDSADVMSDVEVGFDGIGFGEIGFFDDQ